eukprot:CAMPEP_0179316192 /NCGR_PEP_ID=MMETSP0797-20121207/55529_1 /TAXON_ID=47934 /ORGANISM="Dinophysis acuminata, Strain DAEP01" /LENGTH=82 /DNA_ID=CAMNT_0021026897 /DNA_START=73 /DNA_END=317 /DNA_ORIENTATION=+
MDLPSVRRSYSAESVSHPGSRPVSVVSPASTSGRSAHGGVPVPKTERSYRRLRSPRRGSADSRPPPQATAMLSAPSREGSCA